MNQDELVPELEPIKIPDMYYLVVLNETLAQEFVALFGEKVMQGEHLIERENLEARDIRRRYLSDAYNALLDKNNQLNAKFEEIHAIDPYCDLYFAYKVEKNTKLNLELFLNNKEVNHLEKEKYKERLELILTHLDNNYTRARRVFDPKYKVRPRSLSSYKTSSFNDNSVPDPD